MADKTIKILSIDGGGIRGIVPAIILGELQKRIGKRMADVFDLIAGTSTGGIIALGIGTACNNGAPYAPEDLVKMYVDNGPAIFKKTFLTAERELVLPKYSPDSLEETLERFFQKTCLRTALTPLLISSYDLQSQLPFFFKSHMIAQRPNYDWEIVSIARCTSAAPTYFPPYHLTNGKEDYALVDGGVFVNNPAMAAYAEARYLYPEAKDFMVLSVGTGDRQDSITYATAKEWGLIGWAKQIVSVLMDSVSEAVDFEMSAILGANYTRLQVLHLQEAEADMDNVTPDNIANLQSLAREYVASATVSATLDRLAAALQEGRGSNMPGIGRPPAAGSGTPPPAPGPKSPTAAQTATTKSAAPGKTKKQSSGR